MKFDDWIMAALLAVIMAVTGAMIYFSWDAPSCADMHGQEVFDHITPIWSGKTVIMVPYYRCEIPKGKK